MREAAAAYVRRDWLVWSSYRFNAGMHVVGLLTLVLLLATVGDALVPAADVLEDSEDYGAFVLAGLAFADPLFAALTKLPKAVREGQVSGTLEPVLLTPIKNVQVILGSSTFSLLQSLLRSLLVLAVSMLFLGYWSAPNALTVLAVAVPAWLGFLGAGLLAAAFTIVVKQGDPVVVAYAGLSAILGGAFVPAKALPGWLQAFGNLLPPTHALEGVRTGLEGGSLADVSGHVALLLVLAVVALPVGIAAVHFAFRYAKKEGSLVHY